MRKVLIFIIIALFLVSFAVAKQEQVKDPMKITGKAIGDIQRYVMGIGNQEGNLTQAQVQNIVRERNRLRINDSEVPENCTRTGSVMRCAVPGGRIMTVTAGKSGNIIVQTKGVNMSTNVALYKANDTLYGKFKNNETKPINYFPDHVREKIREKLRAHLENETIELDEDGVYQMRAEKKARLFGLFRVRERVTAQINAETGEIIRTRASWWGFLATDEPSGIVGEFCGTVSPTGRNECCQRKGFTDWDEEKLECV